MMTKKMSWLSVACCLAMTACVAEEEGAGDQVEAQAPSAGRADGLDSRDQNCQVVLREVQQPRTEDGRAEVACDSEFCWYVLEGTFDVAPELAAEGTPSVLFRSREGDWFEVEATAAEASVDETSAAEIGADETGGFERYTFRLVENTIREGVPAMTLHRANLELVPFVRVGERRIFDANGTIDQETYPLRGHENFVVEQGEDVCASVGTSVPESVEAAE